MEPGDGFPGDRGASAEVQGAYGAEDFDAAHVPQDRGDPRPLACGCSQPGAGLWMKLPLRIHSATAASGVPADPHVPRGPRAPAARQRLRARSGQGAAQRGSQARRDAGQASWLGLEVGGPGAPGWKPEGTASFHCSMRGGSAQKAVGASRCGRRGGRAPARTLRHGRARPTELN